MNNTHRLRGAIVAGLAAMVLLATAACSSAGEGSDSSTGGSDDAAAQAIVETLTPIVEPYLTPPADIAAAELGEFTPPKDASLFVVACPLAAFGCSSIADAIKEGSEALGWNTTVCDTGVSPNGPSDCFSRAVSEKPSAILTIAIGINQVADGYAAAQAAGIPVIGGFSGNPPDGSVSAVEIPGTGCPDEGTVQADVILQKSGGNPNVLLLEDKTSGCNIDRAKTWKAEYAKQCPDCEVEVLTYDTNTMAQNLPSLIQAALTSNPELTVIAATTDGPAAIAVDQVRQANKQESIAVYGMDGDPGIVQLMQQKDIVQGDVVFGQGEAGWAMVDAAGRILAGQELEPSIGLRMFVITQDTAPALGESHWWPGPDDYQGQFKTLWGLAS